MSSAPGSSAVVRRSSEGTRSGASLSEFQPEGDSQWVFSVTRNGSRNGFTWPVAFTESHAEHQQDGQWINANHFAHYSSGRGDTNWPVVLHQGQ